jgi:hypothetical protein
MIYRSAAVDVGSLWERCGTCIQAEHRLTNEGLSSVVIGEIG